jgi:hypothetical protein
MADSSGGAYRVACPLPVLAQLKAWGASAVSRGEGTEYVEALNFINHKLTTDPAGWGDPLYPLRKVGLMMRRGLHRPLQVHYAVDETLRLVFVKSFALLFDFGGEQGS